MNRVLKAVAVAMFSVCLASWQLQAGVVNITQGSTSGYTMTSGNTYVVKNSVTFSNSTAGGSGMSVADNATVVLYIPAGVTLTAKGANGSGRTGGGAGIRVPQNATLVVTGEGFVNVTGGNAGNGGNGEAGSNARSPTRPGSGGSGGDGGGGAGAGIGGGGGMGGNFDGGSENGGPGESMGEVYVLGAICVEASTGLGGTAGSSGRSGSGASETFQGVTRYASGGGGGGGGGAGSPPTCSIGGGGSAGGTGGAGLSGTTSNATYVAPGATGRGGGSLTKAGKGGYGDSGGAAGSEGGSGTLYVSPAATINADRTKLSATTHSAAQYTITFNINGGEFASSIKSLTATLGCALPNCIPAPTRRGYLFDGWRTASGEEYYAASGAKSESSYPTVGNVTLYAQWQLDHTVTTPEEVPYSYFDNDYPTLLAEHGGDYEAAALATAANGHNKVWECFVAGISPTNETSSFVAKIEMVAGMPIVTWDPDLNTNGVVRTYKVYGSETLENGGDWQYPTNSLHRFFKVGVEMP